MENSNTIQTELQSLSPLIAAMDKSNLYALPEGYFDELPGNLVRLLRMADLNKGFENHQSAEKVPDGYFDQLAGTILNKIKAETSDKAIQVDLEISAELASLKYKPTLEIPAGYFEGLTDSILKKIEATEDNLIEETIAISALVGSIEKKNLYTIPGGYFDNIAQQVQIKVKPAAKVVSISKFKNYFKYAAAAIFIGAVSFAVLKYGNPEKPADTAHLENSIEEGRKMNDKKFEETLNNLSQDDILQYLEKNSTDEDVASLTSDLEDKTLPAQEDYLMDEKTLDKFIEEINTKN